MEVVLLLVILALSGLITFLILMKKNDPAGQQADIALKLTSLDSGIQQLTGALKLEVKENREELAVQLKANREEMSASFREFRTEIGAALKSINEQNLQALEKMNRTLEERVTTLISKTEEINRINREELARNLQDQKESVIRSLKDFQESFDKNVKSFNDIQKEKFASLELKQNEMVLGTERKLEQMRVTVEEKLEKTLSDRLGQSFETVGKQLIAVQAGLGEMRTLASDVGDLKKVLSNVKQRGGVGEIQLEMLLEQILAPDQYEAGVKTKKGSSDQVEFAIKLPGRDDSQHSVYLPVDAKFPKDAYEHLVDAYDKGDQDLINKMNVQFENAIKKMAKDIRDKYLDPPNTTDFGIMFLPFEGIYAEAVRRSSLLEQLQREFKVIITGPTTLAAILNSLQMGFRTLALQKRSSEVWEVLGAVKTEFGKFGDMLEKAQKNIQTANNQLDEVMGKRTRAIQRKLKGIEGLGETDSRLLLPEPDPDCLEDEVTVI